MAKSEKPAPTVNLGVGAMLRGIFAGISIAMLLGACGSGAPAQRVIDEVKGVKFGATFRETLGRVSPTRFNPLSIVECDRDLPLHGCFLSADEDSPAFLVKDGIPYHLQATFNKKDQLTELTLVYERDEIRSAECQDISLRTIDWLAADYGPLKDERLTSKNDAPRVTWPTPAGGSFRVSPPDDEGWLGDAKGKFPNKKSIWVLAHYMVIDGKGVCKISVNFEDEGLLPFKFDDDTLKELNAIAREVGGK